MMSRSEFKSLFVWQDPLVLRRWGWCVLASFFFGVDALSQDPSLGITTITGKNEMVEATSHLGSWIWDLRTCDKQTCRLWKTFDIPRGAKISSAVLYITVDNGYRLFLDGREIGRGSDWKTLTEYDVKLLLHPGRHVLAVEAFNERLEGGLVFGLRTELANGRVIEVRSDNDWKVVPLKVKDWERVKRADRVACRAGGRGSFAAGHCAFLGDGLVSNHRAGDVWRCAVDLPVADHAISAPIKVPAVVAFAAGADRARHP
jgi:hypothetical protein